ncbi:hypothetical protein AAG589_05820 [Isoptericola sp. F-RaC21]|uniref:hypothetical protein n=1 Tax=Isoptericola sp. F-RaC21 TaxID=3141452 RepID=UPI00315C452E
MAGAREERTFGWFAYAPLSGAVFPPDADAEPVPAPASTIRDRFTVRLMNEYSVDWPLWAKAGDDGLPASLDDAIDDALAGRLRAWAATFQEHFDPFDGWDDPRVAATHRAEGEALRDALGAALPEPWIVELDYWETSGA